jgi:hypothetical protein
MVCSMCNLNHGTLAWLVEVFAFDRHFNCKPVMLIKLKMVCAWSFKVQDTVYSVTMLYR